MFDSLRRKPKAWSPWRPVCETRVADDNTVQFRWTSFNGPPLAPIVTVKPGGHYFETYTFDNELHAV